MEHLIVISEGEMNPVMTNGVHLVRGNHLKFNRCRCGCGSWYVAIWKILIVNNKVPVRCIIASKGGK